MSQVILAVSYSSKKLGGAYFEEEDGKIHILHDVAEDDEFVTLTNLLREVYPTNVLVNKSQDAEYQQKIRQKCNQLFIGDETSSTSHPSADSSNQQIENNSQLTHFSQIANISQIVANNSAEELDLGTDENPPKYSMANDATTTPQIRTPKYPIGNARDENDDGNDDNDCEWRPSVNFLPNIAFSFGEARKRLEQLFSDGARDEHLMASFRFDFSATNMIRALGALLRYIEQQRIGIDPEDDGEGKSPIKSIHTVTLEDCVEVDPVTVRALEIFYSDYRPETIRKKFVWGQARKEGMSVFKLCNLCRSSPGKQMLRNWFERPTRSRQILTDRQDGISFFFHDCNLDATAYVRNQMKDIMTVKGILRRMNRGNVAVNDWKNFYTTVCTLVKFGTFLREREVRLGILKDRMKYFEEELTRVTAVLIEMIDFQESMAENRFVVRSGQDPELDRLKQDYEGLPQLLTEVAGVEAEQLHVEQCSVAYMPIIGYLLMIPETVSQPTSPSIKMVFTMDGTCYYKSPKMQDLDEKMGDIKMQIIDVETTIALKLQKFVLKHSSVVNKALETIAILDCLTSLAMVAREYDWVRPKFVEEPVLDISRARHPIAEHICTAAHYVANPIVSTLEDGKVKILSGPNASGKSVYLKMVGVVIYLAHIGSFVPANSAVIGPINRIMSRLYTVDSVLDGMSSFANDLKQMSNAIRKSDEHSLLIIDEFGKGTMTEVGLSLLASCLNWWLESSPEKCPHIFVASHFHALRTLLIQSDLTRYQTMDVLQKEDDSLEFQFKLVDGLIDMSYATFTALKMGIPRDIVNRAEEVYLHLRVGGTLAELGPSPFAEESEGDDQNMKESSADVKTTEEKESEEKETEEKNSEEKKTDELVDALIVEELGEEKKVEELTDEKETDEKEMEEPTNEEGYTSDAERWFGDDF